MGKKRIVLKRQPVEHLEARCEKVAKEARTLARELRAFCKRSKDEGIREFGEHIEKYLLLKEKHSRLLLFCVRNGRASKELLLKAHAACKTQITNFSTALAGFKKYK